MATGARRTLPSSLPAVRLLPPDTGPDARGPQMLVMEKRERTWEVQQILGDPEGDHDWRILATVDLEASDDEGELVLDVTGLVRL